jgi:hypothetical protein
MTTKKERMAPPGTYRVIAFSDDPLLTGDGRYVGDYPRDAAFRMADEQNKNSRSTSEDYHVFNEWGNRVHRKGGKTSTKDYRAASQTPTFDPELEIEDGGFDE